jgi:predicted metal-binding protein
MKNAKASDKGDPRFSSYEKSARDRGISDAISVKTSEVYTGPWVRMKCQFGCAGYGRTLCCPPHTPTPDEMRRILDSYSVAILLHSRWEKGYTQVNNFNDTMVDLERMVFLDGYHKAWSLGSGPCTRCKECSIPGTCLHADRARPSMEGCGIDVFKTARHHGLPIRVLKAHDEARDVYGLLLIE